MLLQSKLLVSCFRNTSKLSSRITRFSQTRNIQLSRRLLQNSRPGKQARGFGAIKAGEAAVATGSLVGVGALCYYGLGLSRQPSLLDQSVAWPGYVRQRIRDVYFYFTSSVCATAASAYLVSRNPSLLRLLANNGVVGMVITFALLIGSSVLCQSVPYQPGFGAKQLTLLLHNAVLGATIAPLCFFGGPAVVRAAVYTAGVCCGLSTVAVCAPDEKFLSWGAPLGAGLFVVFLSSLAGAFLPPTSAAGLTLFSLSMYGGLILFCLMILHDTQRVIDNAKKTPPGGDVLSGKQLFDPVNNSMSIYMDAVNIFVRMLMIMGNNNKRK